MLHVGDCTPPRDALTSRLARYVGSLWVQLIDQEPSASLRFMGYVVGLACLSVLPGLQSAGPLVGQRVAAVFSVSFLIAGLVCFYLAAGDSMPRWVYRLWPHRRGLFLGGLGVSVCASIVSIGVVAALPFTFSNPHHYANDAVAATDCATHLVLQGRNPYSRYNLVDCFARNGLNGIDTTPLQAGEFTQIHIYPSRGDRLRVFAQVRRAHVAHPSTFESYFSYPAGAFLLPAAFMALGWQDLSSFYLVWAVVAYGLLAHWAPHRWRPWLFFMAVANVTLWTNVGGGQSNVLDVFLILASWATWKSRWLSALLMGLAVATRQEAWLFAPFYLVMSGCLISWRTAALRLGVIGGIFGLINAPFVLASPSDWLHGVLGPLTDPMYPLGDGLIALSTSGVLPLWPRTVYTGVELVILVLCLLLYARTCRRQAGIGLVLALVPVLFAWRSLFTYFYVALPLVCLIPFVAPLAAERSRYNVFRAAVRAWTALARARPVVPSLVVAAKTARRQWLGGVAGLATASILVVSLAAAAANEYGALGLDRGRPVRAAPGTISWPAGQELPTFPAPASRLDYVDLTNTTPEDKALVASLQGLVNRNRPRIYVGDNASEGNTTWARSLNLPLIQTSIDGVLSKYARLATGIIIWDPSQPDTMNLATTIAGLRRALVASPVQAALLTAPPYRLHVLVDLRGRFTSRVAVYQYAYRTIWRMTTHKILIGLNPSTQFDVLRDYAVANGLMVINLDPSAMAEAPLYELFVADMPVNGAYMGWFPNDVTGEVAGTSINSRYGVMTFASDYFLNMTVLAGTGRSITVPKSPPPPPLQNKIYVAFNVSDGDNMQENEHRMRQMWDDHARGQVPLSWTISPGLIDAAPGILRWYWRTATPNDELAAGVSGLGYVRPDAVPCSAFDAFTRRTSAYVNRAGLTVVHLLDTSNTLPACAARAYKDHVTPLLGLLQAVGGVWTPTILGGRDGPLPYVRMDGYQTSGGALVSAVQRGTAGWDGHSPRFIAAIGVAWDLMPSDFVNAMNQLRNQSDRYVFVRDDQLMALIRQAAGQRNRSDDGAILRFAVGKGGFIGPASKRRPEHA